MSAGGGEVDAAALRRARPVLVTGGAGFIGSHLSERLLGEGYRVVCVDNLVTGSYENVAHLAGSPGFEYLEHDAVEPIDRMNHGDRRSASQLIANTHLAQPNIPLFRPGILS